MPKGMHIEYLITLSALSVRVFTTCLEHISYIIKGRNLKYRMWMQLGIAKCRIPFWCRCKLGLTSCLSSRIIMSRAYFLYYLT